MKLARILLFNDSKIFVYRIQSEMNHVLFGVARLLILLTAVAALAARAEARPGRCGELFASTNTAVTHPLKLSEIHYVVLGAENSGDPVLMVHGVGSSLETYQELAAEIAKTRKVVLFDLRGHGTSRDPGEGYDLPTLVSDIGSLVSGLKLRNIQLIGHSAGAKIAMLFATQYPELVSSVILEDCGVLPMGTSENTEAVRKDAQYLRSLNKAYASPEDLAKDLLPISEHSPDKALELARKVFPSGTRRSAVTIEVWKNFKATDASPFLKGFAKPVLFLRAAPSTRYFTAKDLELIQNQMPNAKVLAIEKTSHSIHETTPQAWLKAVHKFLH